MNRIRAAQVVLSGCGQCRGEGDVVSRAAAIVGADSIEPAAQAIAQPWVDAGGGVYFDRDAQWPTGMEGLGQQSPLVLWVKGRLPDPPHRCVAIVGSRDCTGYGRSVADDLARAVATAGGWVISGGASGIDAAAHQGALAVGGHTVICAAGGAGTVYPRSHSGLFESAVRQGAVVWEHPPGAPLTKRGFLHRNRLISAMAGTTVLVEAAERSGALNTGRTSADLGRLVLGVPGPMNSPVSAGIHRGISEGWAGILLGSRDLLDLTGLRVEPV